MRLVARYARPVGVGLVLAGLIFLVWVFAVVAPVHQTVGYDAFAYWNVSLPEPYGIPLGSLGSFLYSPPVAIVADWFSALDWWVFLWCWIMLLVGTVIWIAGSRGWVLVAFAIPFVAFELYHGNIHILLAAAAWLGFQHPWAWAFVLLTKPTAGVGLLCFAVRREWRPLFIALGTTAAICLASVVLWPSLWQDYVDALLLDAGRLTDTVNIPVPLWVRLPAAAILVTWGALTDRRWTVVVSAMLALPVLWLGAGAMLIGVIPAIRAQRAEGARRSHASARVSSA